MLGADPAGRDDGAGGGGDDGEVGDVGAGLVAVVLDLVGVAQAIVLRLVGAARRGIGLLHRVDLLLTNG